MAALSYHEQEIIENTKRLRQMLKELPPFCADFFRGIEPTLFPKNQTNSADNIRQKVTHLPYLLSDPLINNTQNKHDNCKRYIDSAGNFPKQGRH